MLDKVTNSVVNRIMSGFHESLENIESRADNEMRKIMRREIRRGYREMKNSHKRVNGFNMFIAQSFQKYNTQRGSGNRKNNSKLFQEFSREWMSLSNSEKQVYSSMAKERNLTNGLQAPILAPKKITGYNLFQREMKDVINAKLKPNEKTTRALSKEWHLLDEPTREKYRQRASKIYKDEMEKWEQQNNENVVDDEE